MGKFAGNSIGFILQMQDEMSPQFGPAERGYKSFVKAIEGFNKQAFKSSTKGMKALGGIVESFAELPKQAIKSYDATIRGLQKRMKVLKQPIEFTSTPQAKKKFQGDIAAAMVKAFSKVTLRMAATVPQSRSKLFDTSVPLRRLYHKIPQPPDMTGKLKLTGLAKGGVATPRRVAKGAGPKVDDQLAVLARNELVAPADVSKQILNIAGTAKNAAGKFTALPADLSENLARVENLMKAIPIHQALSETGLNPSSAKHVTSSLKEIDKLIKAVGVDSAKMHNSWKMKFLPTLAATHKEFESLKGSIEGALSPAEKLLKGILGPTKFTATMTALDGMKKTFETLRGGLGEAVGTTGAHAGSWVETLNATNKALHLTGKGLNDFQADMTEAFRKLPDTTKNADLFRATMVSLAESGVGEKVVKDLTPMLSMVEVGMNVSAEAASHWSVTMTRTFNATKSDIADQFAMLNKLSTATGTSIGSLTEDLQGFTDANTGWLTQLNSSEQRNAMATVSKLFSIAETKGLGKEFQGALSGVGDIAHAGQLASLFQMSQQEFQQALASGDLKTIVSGLQQSTAGMKGAPQAALANRAATAGMSQTGYSSLINNMDAFTTGLDKVGPIFEDVGKGINDISNAAKDASNSFGKFSNWIHNIAANLGSMAPNTVDSALKGMSGVASLLQSLASLSYLLGGGGIKGLAGRALGGAGKMMGGAGGFLGGAGKMVMGAGGKVMGKLGLGGVSGLLGRGIGGVGAKGLGAMGSKIPVIGSLIAGGITYAATGSVAKGIGSGIGTAAGMLIGGALGTLLGPAGTVLGGVLGATLGGAAGEWVGGLFDSDEATDAAKSRIADGGLASSSDIDTVSKPIQVDIGDEHLEAVKQTNFLMAKLLEAVQGGGMRQSTIPLPGGSIRDSLTRTAARGGY